ncbi:MAG: FmdB family zinc ribbon protein [Bryobacteraceae bacterium]
MPLYEYRCEKCGSLFEVIQKFADEPLTEHAGCGGAVERLLSAPALQFKGTGWYITDYAKSGSGGGGEKKGSGGEKSESKSSEGSKSETKSETKTESKAETKSGSDSGKSGSGNSSGAK